LVDATPTGGNRAALRGFNELKTALNGITAAGVAESTGVAAEAIAAVNELLAGAENLVIFYGRDALAAGPNVTGALANLLLMTRKAGAANSGLVGLLPGANGRGALDMGVRPDRGAGYAQLAQPGLDASQMFEAAQAGRLKALYIAGLDPIGADPAKAAALKKVELVVVQELFLTETAKLADVVFPVQSVAEREGTFTNAERRVQRFRQARRALPSVRPDWQIIQSLANQLVASPALVAAGAAVERSRKQARREDTNVRARSEWNYASPAGILMDVAAQVATYKHVSYATLQGPDGAWGRQTNENYYFDGTSYENTGGLGIQVPAQVEANVAAAPLQPFKAGVRVEHADRPWTLVGAPFLYDDSALMTDANLLNNRKAKAQVAMHPLDADQLGVRNGDRVTLASARGALTLPVYRTRLARPGLAVVPIGVEGAPLADIVEGAWTAVSIRRAEG
jgi:NADH-quinone oxidoreductase subunit G